MIVRRELFEETGLNIIINKNDPFVKINNSVYYIFYTDDNILNNLKPTESKEIAEIRLVLISDILSLYNINKELQVVINNKLKFCFQKAKIIT